MKLLSALAAAAVLPLHAVEIETTEDVGMFSKIDISKYIDAATLRAKGSFGMGLDNSPADIDFTEIGLLAFITKPIAIGEHMTFISYVDLQASNLSFDGNPLIGSISDDIETNLYRVGVPFVLIHADETSRWVYGAWVSPAISSDFDHVDSDDFFLDAAIGAAYRWNSCLTVGVGIYGADLLSDPWVIPGAGFVWVPNDDWLISYYGPRFVARREIGDRHQLGLEVSTNGGTWNIDANNASLKVNLSSWRSGLYYRYNVAGEVWLEAGAGFTFGNELELQTRGGLGLFENRLGKASSSPYAFFGVSVARW